MKNPDNEALEMTVVKPVSFTVSFKKDGMGVGAYISYDGATNVHLEVNSISDDGALHAYNSKAPADAKVIKGDFISMANGVHGKAADIYNEIAKAEELELTVLRICT